MEHIQDTLQHRIDKAGFPVVYLQTSEDQRAHVELLILCQSINYNLFTWSCGRGLVHDAIVTNQAGKTVFSLPNEYKVMPDTSNPLEIMEKMMDIKTIPARSIVNLRLFDHFLDDPAVQTYLLDIFNEFKKTERCVVITTPLMRIPAQLDKYVSLVSIPLPSKEYLEQYLDGLVENNADAKKSLTPEVKKTLVIAATGLTSSEAENSFSLSYAKGGDAWDTSVVLDEKCQAVKKSGVLEYIEVGKSGMSQIGGLGVFKKWMSKRKKAFSEKATEFGLPKPKGVLLVGPSGSGKSLAAKATAEELGLPLLKLDVGRIFGSLVGQSESNLREALATAEAMAPCVLWADEIEKGFAGGSGGGNLDSGVSARVFGAFLTWMAENKSPVFIVATANHIASLPPELLRKGRFDEIFSVMLPSLSERKEIFKLHLVKRGREKLIGKNPKIDIEYFAERTEGFSGAEIEATIVESMFTSFDADQDLNFADLDEAIKSVKPLSVTMKEEVEAIKQWCKDRTRCANDADESEVPAVLTNTTAEAIMPSLSGRKIKNNSN